MKKLFWRKRPLFWEMHIGKTSIQTQETETTSVTLLQKTIDMFESRDSFQMIKQSENTANKIQRFIGNNMKHFRDHPQICSSHQTTRPIVAHAESGITHEVLHWPWSFKLCAPSTIVHFHNGTDRTAESCDLDIIYEGKFLSNQRFARFISVGPDCRIQQENRELIVTVGIVWITQNENLWKNTFSLYLNCRVYNMNLKSNNELATWWKEYSTMTGGKLSE